MFSQCSKPRWKSDSYVIKWKHVAIPKSIRPGRLDAAVRAGTHGPRKETEGSDVRRRPSGETGTKEKWTVVTRRKEMDAEQVENNRCSFPTA